MARLPLAEIAVVQAELDDTVRKLDRLYDTPAVSPDHAARRVECQRILERWRDDLQAQLDEMSARKAA